MAFVAVGILAVMLTADVGAVSQSSPPIPYYDWGACPFECCMYREWIVNRPTRILKERRRGAGVAFSLQRGEKVVGVTGVVVTTRAGVAKVFRATRLGEQQLTASPGDVIHVLNYVGEGYWKFWFHGRVDRDQLPDITDQAPDADVDLRIVVQPQSKWWVKVRNRRGQVGWTDETDHFDHMDACGR